MRTILLFRHAQTDLPGGRGRCLGSRTDVPAAPEGLIAAARCAPLLREMKIGSVWSSPMLRCRETARALAGALPVGVVPGLEEADCGAWDGLGFDEIRERFPEEYARRGQDPALPPPGGEPPEHAARRGLAALSALAERTNGDLAVVSHAGINRAMLCALMDLPMSELRRIPQPYLCANVLRYDGARFSVAAVGHPADQSLPSFAKEET